MSDERATEDGTMGTTATPGKSGADAIDEADAANGSAAGAATSLGLGGQADPPGLPFDHKPDSSDPAHSPAIAAEHGEGGDRG